jgi:HSP20 family protein
MKNNLIKRGSSLVDQSFVDFYNLMEDFFDDKWTLKPFKGELLKVDIQELDNEYRIEAEVPGFKKEEIEVEIHDQTLMIRAKHHEAKDIKNKNYLQQERSYNEMYRSIYLVNALATGVKAKLENGVLKLTVLKEKNLKIANKIEIE